MKIDIILPVCWFRDFFFYITCSLWAPTGIYFSTFFFSISLTSNVASIGSLNLKVDDELAPIVLYKVIESPGPIFGG